MKSVDTISEQVIRNGFAIIDNIFTSGEIDSILQIISTANQEKPTFRKTNDLFAIRQFFKEFPEIRKLLFTKKLISVIVDLFGGDYSIVKSIYFDKPAQSNWFVAWHQDLTISVDKKIDAEGFGSWTVKQDQFAVRPPAEILENNFTIRIHLDDTDENNGALKVMPASHLKGIHKPESAIGSEVICKVKKGGIMIMRPLLFHASNKTTNNQKRRVIHIEFSNSPLPAPLQWSEQMSLE
jgi:ectoine hydroxylase-related dioxygenase (phytanoyl-CoA dioxygenase family)